MIELIMVTPWQILGRVVHGDNPPPDIRIPEFPDQSISRGGMPEACIMFNFREYGLIGRHVSPTANPKDWPFIYYLYQRAGDLGEIG